MKQGWASFLTAKIGELTDWKSKKKIFTSSGVLFYSENTSEEQKRGHFSNRDGTVFNSSGGVQFPTGKSQISHRSGTHGLELSVKPIDCNKEFLPCVVPSVLGIKPLRGTVALYEKTVTKSVYFAITLKKLLSATL